MLRMNQTLTHCLYLVLTCSGMAVLSSCNPPIEATEMRFPAQWDGEWTGVQPAYPMRDAQGNIIYIQGKEAVVKASDFAFTISEDGGIKLTQSIDDGRIMEYQGNWSSIPSMIQIDSKTQQEYTLGIRCELSASSGAYRNYILQTDTVNRTIQCIGTPREPRFSLSPLH